MATSVFGRRTFSSTRTGYLFVFVVDADHRQGVSVLVGEVDGLPLLTGGVVRCLRAGRLLCQVAAQRNLTFDELAVSLRVEVVDQRLGHRLRRRFSAAADYGLIRDDCNLLVFHRQRRIRRTVHHNSELN